MLWQSFEFFQGLDVEICYERPVEGVSRQEHMEEFRLFPSQFSSSSPGELGFAPVFAGRASPNKYLKATERPDMHENISL